MSEKYWNEIEEFLKLKEERARGPLSEEEEKRFIVLYNRFRWFKSRFEDENQEKDEEDMKLFPEIQGALSGFSQEDQAAIEEELENLLQKETKSCRIPWFIAGFCILLAILFGLNWYLVKAKRDRLVTDLATVQGNIKKAEAERDNAKSDAESARAARNAAESKLKECQEVAAKTVAEAMMKLATIGKGEGIEHAFIRQLTADSSLVDGVKLKAEDGNAYDLTFSKSKKSIKEWAGWAADKIARNQGYVAGDRQVWVKTAGVIYLLEKKGDVVTKEIEKGSISPSDTKETSSLKVQVFEGDQKGALQGYEMIHIPAPAHAQAGLPALFTVQDLF